MGSFIHITLLLPRPLASSSHSQMTTTARSFSPGLLLLLILPLLFPAISGQTHTITADQTIRDDGETSQTTLVSSSRKFALGFFSPRNSKNRYVGMWFNNITETTIVWVANRDSPMTDNSGVLRLIHPGILILLNSTNGTVWASNATTTTAQNPVAQLLDSGNLVVRDGDDESPENFLWQSFDYPTDTYLPGMNLGWNLLTGKENYLSSWKSHDDPATGEYSLHLDPTGYPQMVIRKGSAIQSRIGPWNGIRFPGPPNPREDPTYRLSFVMDAEKVYYRSDSVDSSFVSRYTMNQSGVSERWTWVDRTREWVVYFNTPADTCDKYQLCGVYGSCNAAGSPLCGCLDTTRFVPRDPVGWVRADWSNGCVRRTNLSCQGDKFVKYSGIKLPDARNSSHNSTMTIEECESWCLSDCSCMAYSRLDVRNKSGCLIWYGDLVDMKVLSEDGQVIHIRMASSEVAADLAESGGKKRVILIASLVCAMGVVVLVLGLSLCLWKRKRKWKNCQSMREEGGDENHSGLPFWDLSIILKATNNFSSNNKLGEGGFGPVYKGKVEGGQEIAVKRLSKESRQGLNELQNEVVFIAKLQHRNLVKLLGCCIRGEERMLIYEYLPNKSLDVILFDETKRRLLNWHTRFNIINGIARGLLYLHQDSPVRIIHRDLKASNILLDSQMNPKISDFGLARSFGGNETEAQTRRVVGTYGYMSPEYAVDGMFSIKSDVFSFGVLVLEIVCGKRNRGFSHSEHSLNLLGHAWKLCNEGRSSELVDASLNGQFEVVEFAKSIRVGLLCVQQNPEDRPNMSSVVWMLGNEGEIPEAKHPGFFTEREMVAAHSSNTSSNAASTINEVTITMPYPR